MSADSTKIQAYDMVKQFSPDELPLFEAIWSEAVHSPERGLDHGVNADQFVGVGLEFLQDPLFSAVVIPIIVTTVSQTTKNSVDWIFEYLKKRLRRREDLSDEKLKKISEIIQALK